MKSFKNIPTIRLVMDRSVDYRTVKQIKSSKCAYRLGLEFWKHSNMNLFEEFYVVYLNNQNTPIGTMKVGEGTLTSTVVDIQRVMTGGLLCRAKSMILFHNHPSGNHMPSQNDIELTEKFVKAANLLDLKVLDHIILTDTKFSSLADDGII